MKLNKQKKYLDIKKRAWELANSQRYEDARLLCEQLCGAAVFTRNVESAYRDMWCKYCE